MTQDILCLTPGPPPLLSPVAVVLPCSLSVKAAQLHHTENTGISIASLGYEPVKAQRQLLQTAQTVRCNKQEATFTLTGYLILRFAPRREKEQSAEENALVRVFMNFTARRTLLGRHIVGHPVVPNVNSD